MNVHSECSHTHLHTHIQTESHSTIANLNKHTWPAQITSKHPMHRPPAKCHPTQTCPLTQTPSELIMLCKLGQCCSTFLRLRVTFACTTRRLGWPHPPYSIFTGKWKGWTLTLGCNFMLIFWKVTWLTTRKCHSYKEKHFSMIVDILLQADM